jgi:hypothetical protein
MELYENSNHQTLIYNKKDFLFKIVVFNFIYKQKSKKKKEKEIIKIENLIKKKRFIYLFNLS